MMIKWTKKLLLWDLRLAIWMKYDNSFFQKVESLGTKGFLLKPDRPVVNEIIFAWDVENTFVKKGLKIY